MLAVAAMEPRETYFVESHSTTNSPPRHERHAPVEHQDDRAAGEDALAAAEAEEHREHVPELAADAPR